jgi:hypothetical protein
MIECPECKAANPVTNRFCDACGLAFPDSVLEAAARRTRTGEAPAQASPSPRRTPRQRDRLAEQRDRQFVGRARSTLSGIRGLYGVLAVLTLLLTWATWVSYLETPERSLLLFAMVTLFTAEAMLNCAGFLYFRANPFLWTTVLACLQTLNLALTVLSVSDWGGGAVILVGSRAVLTISLWCAVPITARITRIWEEQAATGGATRRKGTASGRLDVKAMRAQRASLRQFGVIAGAIMAFSVIAAWFPYRTSVTNAEIAEKRDAIYNERVAEFDSTLQGFRSRWNGSDRSGVRDHFSPTKQRSLWPSFDKQLQKKGWEQKLPLLGQPEAIERAGNILDAHFPIDDSQQLKTRWEYTDGRWQIDRVLLTGRSR